MADHYRVLGLSRDATKEEIKEAFRKLAVKYHPDKHVHSPEHVRLNATHRFKQVSEAYDVLGDDRKRASYNFGFNASNPYASKSYSNPYGHYDCRGSGYGYGYGYSSRNPSSLNFKTAVESAFRYMTTRAFLLNLTLAGGLYFGFVAIDTTGEALWKIRNSGKSFEEAMESIERARGDRGEGVN